MMFLLSMCFSQTTNFHLYVGHFDVVLYAAVV
jgi:hypothetical protein